MALHACPALRSRRPGRDRPTGFQKVPWRAWVVSAGVPGWIVRARWPPLRGIQYQPPTAPDSSKGTARGSGRWSRYRLGWHSDSAPAPRAFRFHVSSPPPPAPGSRAWLERSPHAEMRQAHRRKRWRSSGGVFSLRDKACGSAGGIWPTLHETTGCWSKGSLNGSAFTTKMSSYFLNMSEL